MEVDHSIRTPIHTNKKGTPYSTVFYPIEGTTVQQMFRGNAEKFRGRDHLGFRPTIKGTNKRGPFSFIKFEDSAKIVTFFGSGLRSIGLNTGDKVGIMAKNCVEWTILDYSCGCQSFVSVPVYDSYGPSEMEFIIVHSDMKAIVVSSDKVSFVASILNSGSSPNLKDIIVIDDPAVPNGALPDGATHKFSDIVALGKANPVDDVIAKPDDVFTIVYTSGTTGSPKGAILTHNNVAAGANMLITRAKLATDEAESLISYLPLAHIFARVLEIAVHGLGGAVGYYSGTMNTLTDDILALRPTILAGVPRVFSKTYTKIQATVNNSPWYKRWTFNLAYNAKLRNLRLGYQTPWADKVVFNGIQKVMGGRIRLIYNGAAALPPHVNEFISTIFGVCIGEGYGLTETSATITCGENTAFDPYNVGVPYIGSQVSLMSVPEMDYSVHDTPYPRGEILSRGPQNFVGYYKDDDAYKQAVDAEGWFHTGDIGAWVPGAFFDDDGKPCSSLRIIDRKKNIFKLSQGEFICAERVEAAILRYSQYVKQIIVYGPSTASSLIAFVVPEWDILLDKNNKGAVDSEKWGGELLKRYWDGEYESDSSSSATPASSSSSSSSSAAPVEAVGEFRVPLSLRRLIASNEVGASANAGKAWPTNSEGTGPAASENANLALKLFLLGEMRRVCENEENKTKIKRYEIPRGVVICAEEWNDENKCMTPSMKIKRDFVRAKYKEPFDEELARVEGEVQSKDKKDG